MEFDVTPILAVVSVQCILTMLFILWMTRREKSREKKEEARVKSEAFLVKGLHASISLGEAIAEVVKADNPKSNGRVDRALLNAQEVKHKHRDFLQQQGIENLQ